MNMDAARTRKAARAGSVWESRMKVDQVKGGIKVFQKDEEPDDTLAIVAVPEVVVDKKVNSRPPPPPLSAAAAASGKRKTWKSDGGGGSSSPVQIARKKSELIGKNGDDHSRESNLLKSPAQDKKKMRSDEAERSPPVHMMKTRSAIKEGDGIGIGIEKNSAQLRRVKSESVKVADGESALQLVKAKSVSSKDVDDAGGNARSLDMVLKKTRSDEDVKKFGVCEEKAITTDLVKYVPKVEMDIDDDDDDDYEKIEKDDEMLTEEDETEKKKFVVQENKFQQMSNPSLVKKKSPPQMSHSSNADEHIESPRRTHRKLQSLVDLVMWRDASKSAFVFGLGTFVILSTSYTIDLNISIISILSYLGLLYLAAIFLFRTFITRGNVEAENSRMDRVFGEEEAVWLVNLVLPYVNEFLVNIKALFSGDPLTTMKMAVLLFVLARCGSSITIWKMAKLGFFGVFTVPKICSSYSTQLCAFGTFWIQRFEDAWETCSHKKAVAFGLFTLFWNLSSVVARIWAVFMLFVAFRYFQPSFIRDGLSARVAQTRFKPSPQPSGPAQTARQRRRPVSVDLGKQKKPS